MPTMTWRILVVDDEADICRQISEFLQNEQLPDSNDRLQVESRNDLESGLEALQTQRFDLVILDVRLGMSEEAADAGVRLLGAIKERRFLPVVFYTGLPRIVENMKTSLVGVVEKTAGLPALFDAIVSIFDTRLPAINRALVRHLENVQRDYMWTFVEQHWRQFGKTQNRADLAYFLARRLAVSLSGPGMQQFITDLGFPIEEFASDDHTHPMQYYLMPPIRQHPPQSGDLFLGRGRDVEVFWVLLTPSCDLVVRFKKNKEIPVKAEYVLLAYCAPLTEAPEYKEKNSPEIKNLIKNNRSGGQPERYFFLPAALDLPDLVVDFQQLITLSREQLGDFRRVASLDSPFAEALLARYARYIGRLGTPDLNAEMVFRRLFPEE